jgi:hypothetical protein
MLQEMDKHNWGHDTNEKSTYSDVKDEYKEMLDEISDDFTLFPNPRDTDAEDEDGV